MIDRLDQAVEAVTRAVHGWARGCQEPWPTRGYDEMQGAVRDALAPFLRSPADEPSEEEGRGDG